MVNVHEFKAAKTCRHSLTVGVLAQIRVEAYVEIVLAGSECELARGVKVKSADTWNTPTASPCPLK